MAQRRMFSLKIVDTDEFIDMPASSRLLYYDLSMRADDDGFVSGPKKIIKMTGASNDDYRILESKQFIFPFENGVCVIKDWKVHNYIQKDRYQETIYKNQKNALNIDQNGSYTKCIQNVSKMDTQVRLELEKELEKEKEKKPRVSKKAGKEKEALVKPEGYDNLSFTKDQTVKLSERFDNITLNSIFDKLSAYKEATGKRYKSDYGAINSWVADAIIEKQRKTAVR